MPKINVYLPSDLAAEVKQAEIPVSEVCQRALQEEVLKMKAATAIGNDERLHAAAARLRASRDGEQAQEVQEGRSMGMSWALESASYSELESLVRITDQNWVHFRVGEEGWPTLYAELEEHAGGELRGTAQLNASSPFDRGLVEGARDAWLALPELDD